MAHLSSTGDWTDLHAISYNNLHFMNTLLCLADSPSLNLLACTVIPGAAPIAVPTALFVMLLLLSPLILAGAA
jgi:hypothetical protein